MDRRAPSLSSLVLAPVVLVALACLSPSVLAQSTPPDRAKAIGDEARFLERERDEKRAQSVQLQKDIAALSQKLNALLQRQAASQQKVLNLKARAQVLNQREAILKDTLSTRKGELSRLLSALQLQSSNPPPPLLVSPDKANDAVRAAILLKAATPELRRRANALANEMKALSDVRRELALSSEVLFTTESEVADQKAEIEDLIRQKVALGLRLKSDVDQIDSKVQHLSEEAKALGGLVSALQTPGHADLGGPLKLKLPVAGPIVRGFGAAMSDSKNAPRQQGISIRAAGRVPVLAPLEGEVKYRGYVKGFGNVVILAAGNGYHVVISGMDQIQARMGATVKTGDVIGRLGGDEKEAQDVYLEVRQGDRPIDPKRFF